MGTVQVDVYRGHRDVDNIAQYLRQHEFIPAEVTVPHLRAAKLTRSHVPQKRVQSDEAKDDEPASAAVRLTDDNFITLTNEGELMMVSMTVCDVCGGWGMLGLVWPEKCAGWIDGPQLKGP